MKEHHVELFVDLLVEKVEVLKAENDSLKQKIEQHRVDNYYNPEDGFAESHKAEYAEVIKSLDSATAKYVELKKQFEELNTNHVTLCKEREEIEFKYENAVEDVKCLREQVAKLNKAKDNGRSGKLNVYERMVEYAKAKGFKFPSLHDMKVFIETGTDADKENVSEQAKTKNQSSTEVDFDSHTKCPNGMHDQSGKPIVVATKECKSCAFHKGVNYDETFVECSFTS